MENKLSKLNMRIPDSIPKEEVDKVSADIERSLPSLKEIEKQSVPIEAALGEGAAEKLEKVVDLIKNNLKKRGIENPEIQPVFFKKDTVQEKGQRGISLFTHVEMYDTLLQDKKLKQLVTFKSVAHETYHSSGRFSGALRKDKSDQVKLDLEASGAGYNEAIGKSALEEGAAMLFEAETFDDIKKIFPEETVDKYNDAVKAGVGHYGTDENNMMLYSKEEDGHKNFKIGETTYYGSQNLVKYLKDKTEDFDKKLEKLRVSRRSLDFARTLDREFGEGTFRKVVTCKVENADKLLTELKKTEEVKSKLKMLY